MTKENNKFYLNLIDLNPALSNSSQEKKKTTICDKDHIKEVRKKLMIEAIKK